MNRPMHAFCQLCFSLFTLGWLALSSTAFAQEGVALTWENQSSKDIKIFWINPDKKEVAYGEVKAGATGQQTTRVGEWWVFRVGPNNILLGAFQAQKSLTLRFDAKGSFAAVDPAAVNPAAGAIVNNLEPNEFAFRNDSKTEVKLFWVNPKGEEIDYGGVKPGESRKQMTTKGHNWLVRSSVNNALLGRFTAGNAQTLVISANQELLAEATVAAAPMPMPLPMPMPALQTLTKEDYKNAAKKDPNYLGEVLLEGAKLSPGQYLLSDDARHKFGLTPAGVLTISVRTGLNDFKLVWISESVSKGAPRVEVQPDGSLVLYDFVDATYGQRTGSIWSSGAKPEVVAKTRPYIRDGKCFIKFGDHGYMKLQFGIPNGSVTNDLWVSPNDSEEKNPIYRAEQEALRKATNTPERPKFVPTLTVRNKLGNPPVKPGERLRTYGPNSPLAQADPDNAGNFAGSLRDAAGPDAEGRDRGQREFGGNIDAQGRAYDLHIVNFKSDTKYRISVVPVDNGFPPGILLEDGNGDRITEDWGVKLADEGVASGPVRLIVRTIDPKLQGHYKLKITPPAEKSIASPSPSPGPTTQPNVATGRGNILNVNEALEAGQFLVSTDGIFKAHMQPDGNLVIRQAYTENSKETYRPTWASKSDKNGLSRLQMQEDGNAVIYKMPAAGQAGRAIWETRLKQVRLAKNKEAYLKLLDSGNLALYEGRPTGESTLLWHTDPVTLNLSPEDRAMGSTPDMRELPAIGDMNANSLAALKTAPKLFSQAAEAALHTTNRFKRDDKARSRVETSQPQDDPWLKRLGLGANAKVTFFRHWTSDLTFLVASDNDIVIIAFRGTESDENWSTNGVPMSIDASLNIENARPVRSADYRNQMVHRGWMSAVASIWDDLNETLQVHQARYKTVAITGHSLGGALAGYTAYRLINEKKHLHPSKQHVLATFAAPHFAYKADDGAPILAGFEYLADVSLNRGSGFTLPAPTDFKTDFYSIRKSNTPGLVVYTVEAMGANNRIDWVTTSWDPAGLVDNALGFDAFFKKLTGHEPTRELIGKVLGSVEALGPVIEIPTAYKAVGNVHDYDNSYFNVLDAFHVLQQDPKIDWHR